MKKSITDSQFNMWRAIIALVYADQYKHKLEEDFINESLKPLMMTDEQRAQLLADVKSPQPLNDVFAKMTEPRDRSHFVYFARLLFWSDGDFSKQEKALLKELEGKVMEQVELKSVFAQVDKVVSDFQKTQSQHKEERGFRQRLVDALIFWEDLD